MHISNILIYDEHFLDTRRILFLICDNLFQIDTCATNIFIDMWQNVYKYTMDNIKYAQINLWLDG